MEKIKVLTDQCIGCGACVGIDPEHFDFNEDGLSHVISEENLESEALKDAIDSCPVGIISLEESAEEFDSEKNLEECAENHDAESTMGKNEPEDETDSSNMEDIETPSKIKKEDVVDEEI